jgi:hypothetical protein
MGKVVTLIIRGKIGQAEAINKDLEKLDEIEPLPPEFDEILVRGAKFS